jgi:hypothetical protein
LTATISSASPTYGFTLTWNGTYWDTGCVAHTFPSGSTWHYKITLTCDGILNWYSYGSIPLDCPDNPGVDCVTMFAGTPGICSDFSYDFSGFSGNPACVGLVITVGP